MVCQKGKHQKGSSSGMKMKIIEVSSNPKEIAVVVISALSNENFKIILGDNR